MNIIDLLVENHGSTCDKETLGLEAEFGDFLWRLEASVVESMLGERRRHFGLLVVNTISHSTGGINGCRYFAVPKGRHRINGREVLIGDEPIRIPEMDCNAPHGFKLPKGSEELCWQSRRSALYSY